MARNILQNFLNILRNSPSSKGIFNPWWEMDPEHDVGDQAPEIRRSQLFHYILERKETARHLLLGEATGYQGGHFTGIPMTSERILLGKKKEQGIFPGHVLSSLQPRRTSRPDIKPNGFSEPTATIVWAEIIKRGDPRDFILWNAFPWHTYRSSAGFLSNRSPVMKELIAGTKPLQTLLSITRVKKVAALGKNAQKLAEVMGIEACYLRHPSSGGATEFRKQFSRYISSAT